MAVTTAGASVEDYGALRAYNGSRATAYEDLRFKTWRGRLVDRLEWRLVFRGLSVLMTRTGRLTSVVDVPAGTGRMTVRLARSGLHVVAVDASADMLAIAEARGGADDYVVGRIEQLPQLVPCADGVVSVRLFGHLPVTTQVEALRQVRAVAKYGAVITFPGDTPWLRLRRAVQARRGRPLSGWHPLSDRAASELAQKAGFEVVEVLRLLGPISETHALVLRCLDDERRVGAHGGLGANGL